MVARLTRLRRRYKLLKWLCLIFSLISATVPGVAAAINVAPSLKDADSKWGLAGYALVIVGIAALIIWRALSKKYASKLPWALSAMIWMWALTGVLFALKKIIEEAALISFVFAIGASVAFVLSSLTDLFKMLEKQVSEDLKIAKIKE
jgi:Na+/melibiose symporter-like transporter